MTQPALALQTRTHSTALNQPSPAPVPVEPWRGAKLAYHQIPPHEVLDRVSTHYVIDVHLSHPYYLEWKRQGKFCRTWMTSGDLCISPAHESLSMRWRDNLEVLSVALEPELLAHVAEDMKLGTRIEIPERHGEADVHIHRLCHTLWAESKANRLNGRVFGETVATELAARLLQRYNLSGSVEPLEGKLSPRCWHLVRDFIEANLGSDISLHEIARVAALSPYHFARCFKATVGVSPHQYVIARRIELARRLLSHSAFSVSQVAAQCGFADQSHLTRHMKRLLGVTPATLLPSRREQKNAF